MEEMDVYATLIESPLGALLGISDETYLYLLEFVNKRCLSRARLLLQKKGTLPPLVSIKNELKKYFSGALKHFKTPLGEVGTPFQKNVWAELKNISYGDTRSYKNIAELLGKPNAYRAVANANGQNRFVIVIPCHRVISHNGGLGGYSAGLERKKWLIKHESQIKCSSKCELSYEY